MKSYFLFFYQVHDLYNKTKQYNIHVFLKTPGSRAYE